jgi:hypothetical protein
VTGNSASAAPKQSGGLSLQSFAQDYVGNGPYTGRDVVPNHQGDIIDAGASGLSGGGNGSASGSGGKGGGDDGDEAICFAAGTRIATPSGEVPVESLRIGGMVLTHRSWRSSGYHMDRQRNGSGNERSIRCTYACDRGQGRTCRQHAAR